MNFGDIYALVLKEYPDILTVDEMSKALGVSTKTGRGNECGANCSFQAALEMML